MAQYIWGRNTVLEALKSAHRVRRLLLAEGVKGMPVLEIADLARAGNVPVQVVSRSRLDEISSHHQGVVAEVSEFKYCTVQDILEVASRRDEMPLILAIDSVQDPQNLGTLLRTADVTGVHGVIVPRHRAVGVTAAVEKSSAGAVEYLKIAQVTNLSQTFSVLKDKGIWVVGVEAEAKSAYDEVDLNMPLALVVGSEGKGISRLVLETCDFVVSLPMAGHVNSLNVAVAGSIVLYHAWRQRKKPPN